MHRQIPCHPFGPGTFPFGQQRECPLYRSEYRQHTQQDLLTVYGRPLFTKYIQLNSVLYLIFVYQLFADIFIWFAYSQNFTVLENIGTI